MLCLTDNDVALCNALTTTDLNAMGAFVAKLKKRQRCIVQKYN
jgi:hypothetical protein